MNIVIIGTGYVGLVTGVGLANLGNNVTFIDLDEDKINIFIELGPGSGILMRDFFRVSKLDEQFLKQCKNIYLFEVSNLLKKFQI